MVVEEPQRSVEEGRDKKMFDPDSAILTFRISVLEIKFSRRLVLLNTGVKAGR